MKKLIIVMFIFTACEQSGEVQRNIEKDKNCNSIIETGVPLYKVVIIDSCEYLVTQYYNANASLTHKGNCKNHKK